MTFVRRAALSVAIFAAVLELGCGDTFRPVAQPISQSGGDPQIQKFAFVVMPEKTGAPGNFTEVDTTGDTAVGQAVLGRGPVHAAFAGNTGRIIVANQTDDNLSVYPTFSPQSFIGATISLPAGSQPVFTFSTSTSRGYVALSALNELGVLDTGTNVMTNTITVGTDPVAIASNGDGSRIFVVNKGDGTVSIVDPVAMSVLQTLTVGSSPSWVQTNADSSLAYVLNTGSNTVSVIDTKTLTVTATIPVGTGPNFASYNVKQMRVWVTNPGSNSVSWIDADPSSSTFNTATTITVGTTPVSIAPLADGSRVYIANLGSDDIWVIDTLNGSIERKIALTAGAGPMSLAASGDSTKVVVAEHNAADIVVIRTSDDTISTRIQPVAIVNGSPVANCSAGAPCYQPSFVIATP